MEAVVIPKGKTNIEYLLHSTRNSINDGCLVTVNQRLLSWLGDEERRLMHLVPAPAVKLMKGRVLSRPGMKKCLGLSRLNTMPRD